MTKFQFKLFKTICGYKNEDRSQAWDLVSIRHLSLDSKDKTMLHEE